jgi:hypothetical protein
VNDRYHLPSFVRLATVLGVNVLSEDAPRLVHAFEQTAVMATLAERGHTVTHTDMDGKTTEIRIDPP